MPTNDERREIAARLRDMAPGSDWPKYVAEACGMDVSKMSNHFHTYTAQLCQRLADLIEPEPERTCRMTKIGGDKVLAGWWKCSECGPVYPPCKDEIAKWALQKCPRCGAKVVSE